MNGKKILNTNLRVESLLKNQGYNKKIRFNIFSNLKSQLDKNVS